jgi:hypothetical protein
MPIKETFVAVGQILDVSEQRFLTFGGILIVSVQNSKDFLQLGDFKCLRVKE